MRVFDKVVTDERCFPPSFFATVFLVVFFLPRRFSFSTSAHNRFVRQESHVLVNLRRASATARFSAVKEFCRLLACCGLRAYIIVSVGRSRPRGKLVEPGRKINDRVGMHLTVGGIAIEFDSS